MSDSTEKPKVERAERAEDRAYVARTEKPKVERAERAEDRAYVARTEKIVERPIRLDYTYSPGRATSRFLKGVTEGRLLGQRCPVCANVYVPPRGSCPIDGVATEEEVELGGKGVVTTFCVVNIPFAGQAVECPYVSATILLDGADIGLFHLIQEIPANEVRMGLRVEAVWGEERRPTLESIKYFRPTGEPDADWESYRDHASA